jgi:hypothetical protein
MLINGFGRLSGAGEVDIGFCWSVCGSEVGVTGKGDPGIVGREANAETASGPVCNEKGKGRDVDRAREVISGSVVDCGSEDNIVTGDCRCGVREMPSSKSESSLRIGDMASNLGEVGCKPSRVRRRLWIGAGGGLTAMASEKGLLGRCNDLWRRGRVFGDMFRSTSLLSPSSNVR